MESIEKITSEKKRVEIKDDAGQLISVKQIPVWNASVANLTLMALGSSAPEILLSVIETLSSLGKCPGELGPSTIVGSAAFNLLVISAVSLYAVNAANDTDEERDATVPVGVKKINDMGVFSITASSSIWAYIWLFLCLRDSEISTLEAWSTLFMFFILIGCSFAADKYKAAQDKKNEPPAEVEGDLTCNFQAFEIMDELVKEKLGTASND